MWDRLKNKVEEAKLKASTPSAKVGALGAALLNLPAPANAPRGGGKDGSRAGGGRGPEPPPLRQLEPPKAPPAPKLPPAPRPAPRGGPAAAKPQPAEKPKPILAVPKGPGRAPSPPPPPAPPPPGVNMPPLQTRLAIGAAVLAALWLAGLLRRGGPPPALPPSPPRRVLHTPAVAHVADSEDDAEVAGAGNASYAELAPKATDAPRTPATASPSPSRKPLPPTPPPAPPPAPPVLSLAGTRNFSHVKYESGPDTRLVRLGRAADNDVVVSDPEVSSKHLRIEWDEQTRTWLLMDLGSLNGTALDGVCLNKRGARLEGDKYPLRDGATLWLGENESAPTLRLSLRNAEDGSPAPDARPLDLKLRWGMRLDAGNRHDLEDETVCAYPLRGAWHAALFCVFDGHCGRHAADAARRALPVAAAAGVARLGVGAVDAVLRDAFRETDAAVDMEHEGCTGTALLIYRDPAAPGVIRLRAANVGDSSVVLCRGGGPPAQRITHDHRLTDTAERARVALAGTTLREGENRILGLSLSRTLGDHFLKAESHGVIAEPFVSEAFEVGREGATLIVASDGLWDVATPDQAAAIVMAAGTGSGGSPTTAADALLKMARTGRSRDDVAVIVIEVPPASV